MQSRLIQNFVLCFLITSILGCRDSESHSLAVVGYLSESHGEDPGVREWAESLNADELPSSPLGEDLVAGSAVAASSAVLAYGIFVLTSSAVSVQEMMSQRECNSPEDDDGILLFCGATHRLGTTWAGQTILNWILSLPTFVNFTSDQLRSALVELDRAFRDLPKKNLTWHVLKEFFVAEVMEISQSRPKMTQEQRKSHYDAIRKRHCKSGRSSSEDSGQCLSLYAGQGKHWSMKYAEEQLLRLALKIIEELRPDECVQLSKTDPQRGKIAYIRDGAHSGTGANSPHFHVYKMKVEQGGRHTCLENHHVMFK